jgi:hypothetical protein
MGIPNPRDKDNTGPRTESNIRSRIEHDCNGRPMNAIRKTYGNMADHLISMVFWQQIANDEREPTCHLISMLFFS